MIRYLEDEERFAEYMKVSVGQAGPVYKKRTEDPYWKSDPNFNAIMQNIVRSVPSGYPGPVTPAAVEVYAQNTLTDMAGRVVTAGLSPEAALKEAHARVEEIYKARRS
jgi:ABC-type glycerol-3-phosphate transport system substrate-binding protein